MDNEVKIVVTADASKLKGVQDQTKRDMGNAGAAAGKAFDENLAPAMDAAGAKGGQRARDASGRFLPAGMADVGREAGKSLGEGLDEEASKGGKKAGEDAAEAAKKSATAKAKAKAGGILGPLLLAGAPAVGAAAGAAIVAGVGVGLVGMAVVVAASTTKVKAQAQSFAGELSQATQAWGLEMSKPVTQALQVIQGGFGQLKPMIGQALGSVGPDITIFAQGLTGLATGAMPGITAAAGRMIPVFTGLSGLMATVGTAVGQTADGISQHSTTIGTSIGFLGQVIASLTRTAGSLVGDLSDVFAHTGGTLVATVQTMGSVISNVAHTALPALGGGIQADLGVINALVGALGPVSSLLGTFGGTAASAALNVSLLGKLKGPIDKAATSLEAAGTKGTAFGNVTTTMSKGLGKVGDSLPVIGIGLAVLGTAMELDSAHANSLTDASDKLASSLEQGGTQAAQARQQLLDARVANQNYVNSIIALNAAQVQGTQDSSQYGLQAGSNATQIGNLSQKIADNKQVADDALKKYNDWAAKMGLTAITAAQLGGSVDILAASSQSASSNTSQLKSDLDILNAAASTADQRINALTDSLAILGDHGLQKAQDYAAQFGNALDGFSGQIGTAKGAVFGLNGELNTNSAAGRDVLSVLEQSQKSWVGQAQAMADAGQSQDAINQALQTNRDRLYDVLHAAHLTDDQINTLLGTYGLIPKDIGTKVHADTQPAITDTTNLIRWIGNQRAYITVDQRTGAVVGGSLAGLSARDKQYSATGGVIGAHAYGGISAAAIGAASADGQVWVGEQGPELVNLPLGTTVTPNSNANAMLQRGSSSSSAGPSALELRITPGADSAVATMIMTLMKTGKIQILPQYIQR